MPVRSAIRGRTVRKAGISALGRRVKVGFRGEGGNNDDNIASIRCKYFGLKLDQVKTVCYYLFRNYIQ